MLERSLSTFSASMMLILTMLGCGILYLPEAMKALGWITGSILLAAITVFIGLTSYLLCMAGIKVQNEKKSLTQTTEKTSNVEVTTKISNITGSLSTSTEKQSDGDDKVLMGDLITYFDVLYYSFPIFAYFVDLLLFFLSVSATLTYVKLTTTIVQSVCGENVEQFDILIVLMFILFCLSVTKNLATIAWASYIAISAVILLIIFVFFIYWINGQNVEVKRFDTDFPTAFSTMIFSMSCQHNILSILSQLKDQSEKNIILMIILACVVGPALYYAVAIFGYFGMGEMTKGSVIELLTKPDLMIKDVVEGHSSFGFYGSKIVVLAFCITLICSAGFEINPAKISLGKFLSNFYIIKEETASSLPFHIITTALILLFCAVSVSYNVKAETLIKIGGGVGYNIVAFILPSIAYFTIIGSENYIMSALSIFSGFLGVTTMLYMCYTLYISFFGESIQSIIGPIELAA